MGALRRAAQGTTAKARGRRASALRRAVFRVGLISDTHGLLRPEAKAFLAGCQHIVHAGDIGNFSILEELRAVAELSAIRGNNDRESWAAQIPETQRVRIGGVLMYVVHDRASLLDQPPPAGARIIVAGHSHKPLIEKRGGVLFVNPGSAGPRRFTLPVAAGELEIHPQGTVRARVVDLMTRREVCHALIGSDNPLI